MKQKWKTALASVVLLFAFSAGFFAGFHQDIWMDKLSGLRPAQSSLPPEESTPTEEYGKPQEAKPEESGGDSKQEDGNTGQHSPVAPSRKNGKTPPVDADRVERSIQETIREIQRNLDEQRRISDEILRQLEQNVHHERFNNSLLHPNGAFLP